MCHDYSACFASLFRTEYFSSNANLKVPISKESLSTEFENGFIFKDTRLLHLSSFASYFYDLL